MSSGEKQHKGRITKLGENRVRWLLVQAAQSMVRLQSPRTEGLWRWAETIAARRGKKVAVVAPARKMAGILYRRIVGVLYGAQTALTYVDDQRRSFGRSRVVRASGPWWQCSPNLLDDERARSLVAPLHRLARRHVPLCIVLADQAVEDLEKLVKKLAEFDSNDEFFDAV